MNKQIIFWVLLLAGMTLAAQNPYLEAVNNEDEVVHLEQWQRHAARPLQAIVKLQDYSSYTIVAPKGATASQASKARTTCPAIQAVLDSFIIESVEQLCPTFVMPREPRRSASYGGGEVRDHDLSQLYLITLSEESPKREYELIEELAALAEVEYAEPNYLVFALGAVEPAVAVADATYTSLASLSSLTSPSSLASHPRKDGGALGDPMYSLQWGLPACGIDSLLTAPKRDTSWRPIIAIIDTGVDIDHPDLSDNIWTNSAEANGANNQDDDGNGFRDDVHGWDFVNQTAAMHDFNSHGTHCAGIAGAVTNNGIGIAGACPDALIMPVAVMQSDGTGAISTIIQGINYARQNGADVISMSIGTYAYSVALEQALAVAYQTAVLVGAAGNDGAEIDKRCNPLTPGPMFPGAFTFVLGVQATSQLGLAGFSNYDCDGPIYSQFGEEQLYNYELSAPGVGIMSTVPNGGYRNYNGTSMATPLVAGGVASLLQRREYLTKEILFGDLINYNTEFMPVDFWTVYNADSIAPAMFQCVAIEINDTAYGDSSMYADAGERLQLYPTIRTVWGPADSVEIWLEFQEFEDTSTIQILQNHVQLGHPLSSYAKAKSANPIDIQIANNVVDGRRIKLAVCATSSNSTDTLRHKFTISVTNGVKLYGMLMGNHTLYPNVQYIVTQNLALPSGDTLFIKPGTTLKIKNGCSINATIIAVGKPDSMITFTKTDLGTYWNSIDANNKGKLDYCIIDYILYQQNYIRKFSSIRNSIIRNAVGCSTVPLFDYVSLLEKTNVIYNHYMMYGYSYGVSRFVNCNIVDNYPSGDSYQYGAVGAGFSNDKLSNCNVFNNHTGDTGFDFSFPGGSNSYFSIYTPDSNYYGSIKEEIIRNHIYDFNTPNTTSFTHFDLSKHSSHPFKDAHGIVWKVEVNGYDAQDEFDSIIPLGVGTHEFKVFFNRTMDTSITPMVAMGVRPPYTQTAISENASWSADSTIYTAHLTLTGRSAIDGLNRIYVAQAQDDEHFEIPYENQRFNVYVASSGSMSAGFQATPGIGKVDLEWNDQEVNYEDFLGFNLYRYQYVQQLTNRHYDNDLGMYVYDTVSMPGDTIRINTSLVLDTTYTDYNVVPGERYYYYYKILSTSLTENSPSKTVSCVPHSTIPGDANGSYHVDVADVISVINYVTGQNPQPFLFEAADVNGDGTINVLDIVNIINIILHPGQQSKSITDQQTAVYTVENDTLYINTPVALAGLQFTLGGCTRADVEVLQALAGFECATVEENGSLTMLFYSMSGATVPAGKTALLAVRNLEFGVQNIALSDAAGNNVIPLDGNQVGLTDLEAVQAQFAVAYPNPFSEKVRLEMTVGNYRTVAIVFTDMTGKRVDFRSLATPTAGRYGLTWDATGLPRGIYFATLYADGIKAQTIKLIVK
ncbi:MAG: S8 family serine peptidase [Bacteroidales bacterium]|nr:S8 family serine peptidase [Bacteroidales bacterium]